MRHLQLLWRNPLYAENAVLLSWRVLIQVQIEVIIISMTDINIITNNITLKVTLMTFFGIWLGFGFIYWEAEALNNKTCEAYVCKALLSINIFIKYYILKIILNWISGVQHYLQRLAQQHRERRPCRRF